MMPKALSSNRYNMSFEEIMKQLELLGNPSTKKTLMNHGAREPFFGVRISDMKPIQKSVKKNYDLSLNLYNTGISDAMYLAGLIADEKRMTKKDLHHWVENAYWHMISDYTVAWVAAESNFGWELSLEWIESDSDLIASAGWSTLSFLFSLRDENEFDLSKINSLLDFVNHNIHNSMNRTRYSMNGFVISVATNLPVMREKAINVANAIGEISVDLGGTSCKVPNASEYIQKTLERNPVPKKKKTVRC